MIDLIIKPEINALCNDTYIRLHRYLTYKECSNLIVWRYFNETIAFPTNKMQEYIDQKQHVCTINVKVKEEKDAPP